MARASLRERWVREVMRTSLIGDAAKLLLLAMSQDMDERGYVSVPRPVLAERIGRVERRVTERLSEAVDAKFLDHVRRGQKGVTPVYRAMLPTSLSETVYSPLNEVQRDGSEPTEMSPDRPAESRFSGTPGGPTSIGVRTRGDEVCSQQPSQNRNEDEGVEDKGDEAAARSACRVAALRWTGEIPAEMGDPDPQTNEEMFALEEWTERKSLKAAGIPTLRVSA